MSYGTVLLIAALAAILLACSQTVPPTPTPEPTATLVPPSTTPIPLPATVPTNPQCPTVPEDDDSDEIKPEEWLVRAIKIAIKEELDKPQTLERVYPREVYFYDENFERGNRHPLVGREPTNLYPVQLYDMRGDFFVHLLRPIRGYRDSFGNLALMPRDDGSQYYIKIQVNTWTLYDSRWGFDSGHETIVYLYENTDEGELWPDWAFGGLPSTKKARQEGTLGCLIGTVMIRPAWESYRYH